MAGDSYNEDRLEIISKANPLNYKDENQQQASKPKATLGILQALGLFKDKK